MQVHISSARKGLDTTICTHVGHPGPRFQTARQPFPPSLTSTFQNDSSSCAPGQVGVCVAVGWLEVEWGSGGRRG